MEAKSENSTKKEKVESTSPQIYGRGLDIGTMNLIAARRTDRGVETTRMRDLFLDLPANSKKMLKLRGANFVDRQDEVFILGDAALEIANVFGREARRPLADGLVSPRESDSLEVLALMISKILGKPSTEGEYCYFSVPAAPVDKPGMDIIYHRGVFERIVSECGYTPVASNEAMAIIYSEAAKDDFSGVGISFGSGMTNLALAVNAIEGFTFSVARGGDWIDKGSSTSIGSTQARMCSIKEKGIDLNAPTTREEEAITFYYKALIEYSLDNIAKQFRTIQGQFEVGKPVPIILSGGTSLAGGFVNLFEKVFETKRKRFPLEISEIRHASDPLNAVAQGMLVQAMQEYVDD